MLDPNERHIRGADAGLRSSSGWLEEATRGFHAQVLRLFDGFYDKLDDTLYDLADKSDNESAYAGYFVAVRLFRKRRPASRLAFTRRLRHASDVFASGASEGGTAGPRIAKAPDKFAAEPEEALVLENLVSKSTSRYCQVLEELGHALGQAQGMQPVPIAANPLGPSTICAAFEAALTPFADIDPPVKLVVYKLFDKQVMDHLGSVYTAYLDGVAPAQLTQLGNPAAAHQRRKHDPWRGPGGRTGQRLSRDAAPPQHGSQAAATPLDLAMLHQRLRRPAQSGRTTIDTSDLLAALGRVQPLCGPTRDPQALTTWLRERIDEGLDRVPARTGERRLSERDEASIELVLRLFEHILAAPVLPAPIKPLIARLEVPILKAALLDQTFFANPAHPARQLLNRTGQAAIGWTDDGERSATSLYGILARTVNRIVAQFGEDVGVFTEQSAQLSAALAARANEVQTWEAKARRVAEGRARADTAERLVATVIRERLCDYENVPAFVVDLLEEGWSQVLTATHLGSGGDSGAWHDGIATVDRLLWSICPKIGQEERRQLLQAIPPLLRKLRLALAESSADPRKVSNWFRDLQALHMAALRGDGNTFAVNRAETSSGQDSAVEAERDAVAEAGSAPWGLPLAIGTWIQLPRRGERPVRMKLIWYDPTGARLLFVDAARHKGVELDVDRMAALIERGKILVVGHEDEGLVERAVAAVTMALETE